MNTWTDPHIDIISGSQGLVHCTAVVLTSTLLSGLIVVVLLYGLKHMRGGGLRALETLLGIALLLAAIEPVVEFFTPYWNSKSDQDALDIIIRRALSWHAIISYVGCMSGLGLFCYLALTEHPSPRRALFWFVAPVFIGVMFMMFQSH